MEWIAVCQKEIPMVIFSVFLFAAGLVAFWQAIIKAERSLMLQSVGMFLVAVFLVVVSAFALSAGYAAG
jgi:uncharacterized membrane protein YidH (DUF202 family)